MLLSKLPNDSGAQQAQVLRVSAIWELAVCTWPPPATLHILILTALPTHKTHSLLGLRVLFSGGTLPIHVVP